MKKHNRRLLFILFVMASLALAAGLSLYALKDNISYFRSPKDVALQVKGTSFRLGGMVKEGSLEKRGDGFSIVFVITDFEADTRVEYTGILPDLFREGQGVIAKGMLNDNGVFMASELLAKHDENYMPPEVAKALKNKKEVVKP